MAPKTITIKNECHTTLLTMPTDYMHLISCNCNGYFLPAPLSSSCFVEIAFLSKVIPNKNNNDASTSNKNSHRNLQLYSPSPAERQPKWWQGQIRGMSPKLGVDNLQLRLNELLEEPWRAGSRSMLH